MRTPHTRLRAIQRLIVLPLVAFGAGATVSAVQAAAPADNKKQFKYQDKPGPKGAVCAGCRFFRKPNACTIVHGKISPKGWCIAWAK